MRLTLRYLLAYLDDYLLPHGARRILEPEDFETIGKKIDESEFAKSLVDRIRDVVRRGRLGAPSETDRDTGLDPNTVAEYLDHALPDARVPDFEKVCLESDVHLAEVACCHQVLAMVVTEPVEVVEETRQRIYELPEAVTLEGDDEEPSTEAGGFPEGATAPEEPPRLPEAYAPPPPQEPRVPEYLRSKAGKSRRTWVLAAVGSLLLLVGAAILVPLSDSGSLLSQVLEWRDPGMDTDGGGDSSGPPQTSSAAPSATEAATAPQSTVPKPVEPLDKAAPPVSRPSGENAETAKKPRAIPPNPMPSPETQEASPKRPGATEDLAGRPMSERPEATPTKSPAIPAPPADGGGASSKAKDDPRSPQPANVQAGLIASNRQLLLRLNAKGVWQRVADETALFANDKLLVLPAFRPRLALAGRTTVELVDATALTLLAPVADGPWGIAVEFGRILAKADEAAGATLRVVAGDRSGVCRFLDADSVVAIEVSRAEAGAGDPETQPGPWMVDLYVTSGKLAWRDDQANKEIQLKAPTRLSVSEHPLETTVLQQLPRWVSGETESPLDQRGAVVMEREVALGRSADLALRELSGDPKREVRWLATRSLSLVEDYQPVLKALDDPEQSRFWTDHIEQLRLALFRGPQSAANVRKAMERQYGPQGAELYELLWKYRADTLQPEDVNRLVDYLGHGALAFRVVGFWNLKNLYAKRTLYYRPDDSPAKRQAAIQKWREKLKTSPMPRNGGVPEPQTPARGPQEEGSDPLEN